MSLEKEIKLNFVFSVSLTPTNPDFNAFRDILYVLLKYITCQELSFLILVLENDGTAEFGIGDAGSQHNETTDSSKNN